VSAHSIQALQQANSIISDIMAEMQMNNNEQPYRETSNAGNSFGVASYGGRQTHFQNPGGEVLEQCPR